LGLNLEIHKKEIWTMMKNKLLLLGTLLTAMVTTSAFAQTHATAVELSEGQAVSIAIPTCKPGYYASLSPIDAIVSRTPMLATKFTAVCAPRICSYQNYWGGSASIQVLPEKRKLPNAPSQQALKQILKTYLQDGTCATVEKVDFSV
jgi:hypothetical protein